MRQGTFIAPRRAASASASAGVRVKNRILPYWLLFAAVDIVLLLAAFDASSAHANDIDYLNGSLLIEEPIQPVPQTNNRQSAIIALGEKLFFDRRLSKNQNIACADCHKLGHGGADDKNLSIKANGQKTYFNTPSIFNVALNSDYYWNAKFNSLEHEIDESVNNLDADWSLVINRLNSIPEYKVAFKNIFGQGISKHNTQICLISFEKSLTTPNSKFDQYLKGNLSALNKSEIDGYHLFKSYGCVACHQGINIGGNISIAVKERAHQSKNNAGGLDYKDVAQDANKQIRVPSLRNVAQTAPYFHDGSVNSLRKAVKIEGKINSNADISELEITQIVKFLHTLTGQYKGHPL